MLRIINIDTINKELVKDIKKETKYKRKNAQFIKSQQIFLEWKNR